MKFYPRWRLSSDKEVSNSPLFWKSSECGVLYLSSLDDGLRGPCAMHLTHLTSALVQPPGTLFHPIFTTLLIGYLYFQKTTQECTFWSLTTVGALGRVIWRRPTNPALSDWLIDWIQTAKCIVNSALLSSVLTSYILQYCLPHHADIINKRWNVSVRWLRQVRSSNNTMA